MFQFILQVICYERNDLSLSEVNRILQRKREKNSKVKFHFRMFPENTNDLLSERLRLSSSSSSDENMSSGIPWAKGFRDGGRQVEPPTGEKLNHFVITISKNIPRVSKNT